MPFPVRLGTGVLRPAAWREIRRLSPARRRKRGRMRAR